MLDSPPAGCPLDPQKGVLGQMDATTKASEPVQAADMKDLQRLRSRAAERLGADAILGCLQALLAPGGLVAARAGMLTRVRQLLACERVSVGWVQGDDLHVLALSDGVLLDRAPAMTELHQAMLEAAHQRVSLTHPPKGAVAEHITLSHQALCRSQGLSAVVSVPMALDGQVCGVLTCERALRQDGSRPLSTDELRRQMNVGADELRWLEELAATLAPVFAAQQQLSRPWHARCRLALTRLRSQWHEPEHRLWRWGVFTALAVLLGGLLVPQPYQVTASAHLEGRIQRVLSAPQDGYLREVLVRPGDRVKAGQLLAAFSDDELQNARRARQAEVSQHENGFADAFSRGDRSQAVGAQAKLSEARAQLALVEQQLSRLQVMAPFDGVVIAGDLRQQLGAALKRGDKLLTLAPGLDWRIVAEVEEADIAGLQSGQRANLRLAAMPDRTIAARLTRVTPLPIQTLRGLRYEVEATPNAGVTQDPGLRPGLQGVVRIEMPAEPLLWRAARRAWHWGQMMAWTWL